MFFQKCTLDTFNDFTIGLLFKPLIKDDKKFDIGHFYLAKIDVFIIPFFIRTIMISTKLLHITTIDELTELITTDRQLQEVGGLQHFLDTELSSVTVKHIHKTIKHDCKSIHTLLAERKHSEAILWIRQYFENHPFNETLTKTINYLHFLCDTCPDQASSIKDLLFHYASKLEVIKGWQTLIIKYIIHHEHILLLMNSGASDEDIVYYRYCSQFL